MKIKQHVTTVTAVLILVACAKEPTYDVQYYYDNAKERQDKLKECGNNPGEKMETPNCINAAAALNKEMVYPKNGKGVPRF